MNRLTLLLRHTYVELLFFIYSKNINLQECLVALIYLVNLLEINVYLNISLLFCAFIHKQCMDTYIAHRFISFTILFSAICIKIFNVLPMIIVLVCILLYDAYYSVRPNITKLDYGEIETLLLKEHSKYLDEYEYDDTI